MCADKLEDRPAGDEIAELAAHIHAATYRLLVLIREFDQREGWNASFRTCAHWLSWRTGIALGSAREKVRVAHALERLPRLSAGMQSGELSYSKARALTRVATAENEEELIDFARHGTASHIEKIVRAWRRVDRLEDQWQERERLSRSSVLGPSSYHEPVAASMIIGTAPTRLSRTIYVVPTLRLSMHVTSS